MREQSIRNCLSHEISVLYGTKYRIRLVILHVVGMLEIMKFIRREQQQKKMTSYAAFNDSVIVDRIHQRFNAKIRVIIQFNYYYKIIIFLRSATI